MVNSKWSDDDFLDSLRNRGDDLADRVVAELVRSDEVEQAQYLFRVMRSSDTQIPADAPPVIKSFLEATRALPPNLDHGRLQRGAEAFLRRGISANLVLSASSLPRIYMAPRMSTILAISGNLKDHAYRRNLGVLQLLVNISSKNAFADGGRAVVAAQKMRLLHAGIRHLTPKYRPDFARRFGIPVNLEDFLFTNQQFSFLVVDGLRRLKIDFPEEEANDFLYLWRVFGAMMGIHPVDQPGDLSLLPADFAEAAAFYGSYLRRHGAEAKDNPEGVALTKAQLDMLVRLIPKGLRLLGLGVIPRLVMTELLSPEELARVNVTPTFGHQLLRPVVTRALRFLNGSELPRSLADEFGALIFRKMILFGRDGEVTFTLPTDLEDLRGRGLI